MTRFPFPRLLPTVMVVLGLGLALRILGIVHGAVFAAAPEPPRALRATEPTAALLTIAPAAGGERDVKAETGGRPASGGEAPPPDASPRQPGDDAGGMSAAELAVLQELAQRRAAIDRRAKELGAREAMLQAAERQIEKKLEELRQLKSAVEATLRRQGEEEDGRRRSLVKIFEGMKPPEAARIFEQMDLPQLVDIVEGMKERNASAVLAQLHPVRARQVAAELARRRPAVAPAAATPPRQG